MLTIAISNTNDGSMRDADAPRDILNANAQAFLDMYQLLPEKTSLVHMTYGGNNYTRYAPAAVDGDGILRQSTLVADGLATDKPGTSLALPVADCIAAVLYDETKNVLMLSHLGRHNLEQLGGTKSVEYMVKQFGCSTENITAWLGPSAGKSNYPLFSFNDKSMQDVAVEQLIAAGLRAVNITCSPIDTTKSMDYFSHSEFKKGNRTVDGRFIVVASLV